MVLTLFLFLNNTNAMTTTIVANAMKAMVPNTPPAMAPVLTALACVELSRPASIIIVRNNEC